MDDKIRCQSCGMPLDQDICGSNSDGTICDEYCKFCFAQGSFTEPQLKMGDMIEKSVQHMVRELNMPYRRAMELANETLPSLKRWKSGGK